MIDFFGLRFIREQLVNILLAFARMERNMSELDSQINARLDSVDAAIAAEKVQGAELASQITQLRSEIETLKQQLGDTPVITQAVIARIELLTRSISEIVTLEAVE